MRDNATEIKKVLDEHQYSINSIIVEVMGTFKLNSIIRAFSAVRKFRAVDNFFMALYARYES